MDKPLSLLALSPLDGRYANKVAALSTIFSEYGLIYYRVLVEVRWLIALSQHEGITGLSPFSATATQILNTLLSNFSLTQAQRIKQIEQTVQHDVKAVEYFLREIFTEHPELDTAISFLHFGCTSEDINNLSYALMVKQARQDELLPTMQTLLDTLIQLAHDYADTAMLARTHGQPATPTTVGKEFANFAARLKPVLAEFRDCPIYGKCNGATGNFNAHTVAYPQVDWPAFSHQFIENLGLQVNAYTTQIEPHDGLAKLLHALSRFNTILLDLCRDCWGYISLNYFGQKMQQTEVGSSTMPHKINPIDFENAEGNLGLANCLALHFAEKLPISRWQRDLSDSTVLRNLGTIFGYSMVAWKSLLIGLAKIDVHSHILQHDLNQHWEVLTEAIQTVLRQHGVADAYERLKQFSRGKTLTQHTLHEFIEQLPLTKEVKAELLTLTPANYLGYAGVFASNV